MTSVAPAGEKSPVNSVDASWNTICNGFFSLDSQEKQVHNSHFRCMCPIYSSSNEKKKTPSLLWSTKIHKAKKVLSTSILFPSKASGQMVILGGKEWYHHYLFSPGMICPAFHFYVSNRSTVGRGREIFRITSVLSFSYNFWQMPIYCAFFWCFFFWSIFCLCNF